MEGKGGVNLNEEWETQNVIRGAGRIAPISEAQWKLENRIAAVSDEEWDDDPEEAYGKAVVGDLDP